MLEIFLSLQFLKFAQRSSVPVLGALPCPGLKHSPQGLFLGPPAGAERVGRHPRGVDRIVH